MTDTKTALNLLVFVFGELPQTLTRGPTISVTQLDSLSTALLAFSIATLIIVVVGTRLTRLADVLADRTGIGEAVAGAVLLGATTSASGTITSITAASVGNVDLAYSNALGGIAAQTAFLAVADCLYRRSNLEHAAADPSNLTQATMLVLLLSVPLIAATLPPVTVFGVHPASVALIALYISGITLARRDREHPMWYPRHTPSTREDRPEPESDAGPSTPRLAAIFIGLVLVTGVAGYVVAISGASIARQSGISGSLVGALMTATATSLPELVTTIAAVRRGALQLAVGGIIGGNTFDVLFLSASDVAYGDGSIYNAIDASSRFWALVGVAMTAVLLLGLIRRQEGGFANIGFESLGIVVLYIGAISVAATTFASAM